MTAASGALDALIIGGGPGGGALAVLLARAGWRVGLLEKATFPRHKVCGEFISASNLPLLRQLGLADSVLEMAGPEVRRVGLFAGDRTITADMPRGGWGKAFLGRAFWGRAFWGRAFWGRAIGRDHFDTLLLERAAAGGAAIWQPWSAAELTKTEGGYLCQAVCKESRQRMELRARIVVAAHGSWEPGPLPTQAPRPAARPSDLFGFKAHFLDSRLPAGLMPLLVFPGGYGGMVHSGHGRVSLSCCIRRDQLKRARSGAGPVKAACAVLAHIETSCRGAREALAGATLEHDWLSAGPIRPGIRRCGFEGIFLVGNAAGEAHPAVAEGIGMAMQSARLLSECLTAAPGASLDAVTAAYTAAWRRTIAPRIHAAAAIAHWAMNPAAVACAVPLLGLFPGVLTAGARVSGKAA